MAFPTTICDFVNENNKKYRTTVQYYQKQKITFMVGGDTQKQLLKQFEAELNNAYVTWDYRGHKKDEQDFLINMKQQLDQIKRTGTVSIAGRDLGITDTERMMAIMDVKFTDGSEVKLFTLSGDSPFCKNVKIKMNDNGTYTTEGGIPLTFHKNGYNFENIHNKANEPVVDLSTGNVNSKGVRFNKSCAAQKAMIFIGNVLQEKRAKQGSFVNTVVKYIEMREQLWVAKGVKRTLPYCQGDAAPSCSFCTEVLPYCAGK